MPENLADFSGYKSFIEVGRSHLRSSTANNSLCDAERKYIRPSVIQDVDGHFYLILQSSFYFQQVPVEICRYVFCDMADEYVNCRVIKSSH